MVVYNVRSCHNVGSFLRSCDGLGINHVYLTGYTPYPSQPQDTRLPHIRQRIAKQIHKTALGAEETVKWHYSKKIEGLLDKLRKDSFLIVALEQTKKAKILSDFRYKGNVALIVGHEIGGIDERILKIADLHLKIPMQGAKESFNVAVAAAVALYHLRFIA